MAVQPSGLRTDGKDCPRLPFRDSDASMKYWRETPSHLAQNPRIWKSPLFALLALAPAGLCSATVDNAPVVQVTGGWIRGALLPGDAGQVF
jgi:hypothetical protein